MENGKWEEKRGLNAEGGEVGAQRTQRRKPKSTGRSDCATLLENYIATKSALRGGEGVC
jgi:hypothetical protein